MKHFLVFGASGSIGEECIKSLSPLGKVIHGDRDFSKLLNETYHFDAVVWAQGLNISDSIGDFDLDSYQNVLDANVTFLLNSANWLKQNEKIKDVCQFVIISSIWSQLSRPKKLTYSISKAAVSAAVRSIAVDLGPSGVQVNAIAPGPIESAMTRQNLSSEQIADLVDQTPIKRLITLGEIASIVALFANAEMSGITGQEIVVDGGWSVSKLV